MSKQGWVIRLRRGGESETWFANIEDPEQAREAVRAACAGSDDSVELGELERAEDFSLKALHISVGECVRWI